MDARKVLGQLEGVAEQLGVKIRYEAMEGETAPSQGGMCRIRGTLLIILNKAASPEEQVGTMVKALRRLDVTGIYLRPGIRDLLEGDTSDTDRE